MPNNIPEWTDQVVRDFILYCRERGGDAEPKSRDFNGAVEFWIRPPCDTPIYPEGRSWAKETLNQFCKDWKPSS